jgi:hypothetical protein
MIYRRERLTIRWLAGMELSDIIARPQDFVGRETSVTGFLMVGADSRLVTDLDHAEGPAVLLPHTPVRARLLSAVPPGGGGHCIYSDDATVVGILSDGPLRFTSVRSLVIRRDGRVWAFRDLA